MRNISFDKELVSPFETFVWIPVVPIVSTTKNLFCLNHNAGVYPLIFVNKETGEVVLTSGVLRNLVACTPEEYNRENKTFEKTFIQTERSGQKYLDNVLSRLNATRNIIMQNLNVTAVTAEEYMILGASRSIPMHHLLKYSLVAKKFLMSQPYEPEMNRRAQAVSSLTDDETEFIFLCNNLNDEIIESFLS